MFASEFLALARTIAALEDTSPHRVGLRRAVSTAYYGLFHFLIWEAASVWQHEETRAVLSRTFEHGRMKVLCEKTLGSVKKIPPFDQRDNEDHLRAFAQMFIRAQETREDADYDITSEWSDAAVIDHLDQVEEAIRGWELIRDEPASRQFLVQLFGPRQRRR